MMLGSEAYETIYKEASEALANAEPQEAFQRFRHVLEYPGHESLSQHWQQALELFAKISRAIAGQNFALKVQRVIKHPDNVNALYELGYELMEYSLPAIAATVLARAHEIAPGEQAILLEFVCALEKLGYHSKACHYLREAPPYLLQNNFLCRYLLAFNSIMIGNLQQPQQILPSLQQTQDPTHLFMSKRIAGMLERAQALKGCSPLDLQDLRGWHFVLTASILLHVSPYGFHKGMCGRYAYIRDSYELIREGIERLCAVLNAWKVSVPRIFVLPEINSTILAKATAKILSCPTQEWLPTSRKLPGLIIVYDLARLEPQLLSQLEEHYPGQMLWSHASCWTQELPFAADLTTYLYQINTAPWEPIWGVEMSTSLSSHNIEEFVKCIVNTKVTSKSLEDLPILLETAHAVEQLTGEQGTAALAKTGQRLKQWVGSPVPSNYFI